MNIQQERELLQELLESGKLDSLSVQVISLNRFAESIGYKAVNGDIRKGFCYYTRAVFPTVGGYFCSLVEMQSFYNNGFRNYRMSKYKVSGYKIVERISLQYNKKISKLTTQKHWLKFVKES
jgi:hypothetical protein